MWDVINQRSQLIREPNEVRILRLVRDSGEISRIELAKLTGLNKSTITDIVNKLIQAGFLEETGTVESSEKVGRRRVLLRFLPLAGLVVGIDIGMTACTVALTDLNARILQQQDFHYSMEMPVQEVLARIAETIHQLLAAANYSQSKLVGMGIGVQGLIDYRTNTLRLSHNKRFWQGASLSAELETRFNVPVYVENDVKTMSLGEYLLGEAKESRTFVHIWVGDGLGAGIMINGHLHRGFTSSAGEIGFNSLDVPSFYREKFPLTYNDQTMFGEILTDANFVESYLRHVPSAPASSLSVAAIVQKAKNRDKIALQIIEEFSSLLSILCINLINTLNPEVIILGGKIVHHYPLLAGIVQEKIHKDLLSVPADAVRVKPARHSDNGVVLGAASLVLFELFEPLHSVSLRASHRYAFVKDRMTDLE